MKLAKKQCKSCPFLPEGLCLPPDKMIEIYEYLAGGTNHLCHGDRSDQTICLGGRTWALETWHSMGIISAPTNEALADAMRRHGVEPKEHSEVPSANRSTDIA